jgi:hypothetical protein
MSDEKRASWPNLVDADPLDGMPVVMRRDTVRSPLVTVPEKAVLVAR